MEYLTDPVFLSRLQFALTTAFHITFPTLSIGLGLYLVIVEWLWLRTGDLDYYRQFRFWSGPFAINFAVGIVTGIPLEFQFGTNWGPFSATIGNFFGHVLGFEGSMAFMLEAAFFYIMLFGWKRVGPKMHFFSTIMVAFAASLSAFWILAANSWMQTPTGGHIENGVFIVDDYLAAIFSPDLPFAFLHMHLACLEVSLFVVGAVSGLWIVWGKNVAFFLKSFRIAAIAALVCAPLQALVGDQNGLEIARLQPAKVAGIEAHWETNPPRHRGLLESGRLARHGKRAQQLFDSHSLHAEPARHPQSDRHRARAQGISQGGPAAHHHSLLFLPVHGRHRFRHGRRGPVDGLGMAQGRA